MPSSNHHTEMIEYISKEVNEDVFEKYSYWSCSYYERNEQWIKHVLEYIPPGIQHVSK